MRPYIYQIDGAWVLNLCATHSKSPRAREHSLFAFNLTRHLCRGEGPPRTTTSIGLAFGLLRQHIPNSSAFYTSENIDDMIIPGIGVSSKAPRNVYVQYVIVSVADTTLDVNIKKN